MNDKRNTAGSGADFEGTLSKIEDTIEQIESGQLSLEQLVGKFKQATDMIGDCRSMLSKVEQQIKVMEQDAEKRNLID